MPATSQSAQPAMSPTSDDPPASAGRSSRRPPHSSWTTATPARAWTRSPRVAAVSKQTVYKQFADKESLFSAIVTSTVDEVSDPVYQEVLNLEDSGDIEADLRGLARRQLALVMQPRLLRLRRLVIGETGPLPATGSHLLRTRPGAHDRCARHRLGAPRRPGPAGPGRPAARRPALQLADHVDPAQPGDVPRRRRPPARADLNRYADAGVRASSPPTAAPDEVRPTRPAPVTVAAGTRRDGRRSRSAAKTGDRIQVRESQAERLLIAPPRERPALRRGRSRPP